MRPLWMLDLNGVLTRKTGQPGVETVEATAPSGRRYVVPFLPRIISEVRELTEVIDVRWCSTWGERANVVGAAMGLPELPVIPGRQPWESRDWSSPQWWKVQRWSEYSKKGPVLWVDDKLNWIGVPQAPGSLSLRTEPGFGLTGAEMRDIRSWASANLITEENS